MTKEIFYLLDQLSREKNIPKDVLIEALESALQTAARKRYGGRENIHLKIERESFNINLYETKTVSDDPADEDLEIDLEEALKLNPDVVEGDEIDLPLVFKDFGRIAAQTAKQVILQRVREAERSAIFDEYKDKEGQIISGTVMRREKGAYYVNIGKTEALLPQKNALPGENLKRGDSVRANIDEIDLSAKGPVITLSRTAAHFVSALFKMEVPEISEGLVVIKDVVREPGERTKIAVYSTNTSVDPVGACVGMKGTRVQSIVRELKGERIDIIPWTDDPRQLIARSLNPATVDRIGINEEEKTAMVIVNDQQLSIAIGKKGLNVKLAMKLTNWDIDIMSETEYDDIKREEAGEEPVDGEAGARRRARRTPTGPIEDIEPVK